MHASDGAPDRRLGLPRLVTLLLVPPVAWGLHTGAVYLMVTIDCLREWNGSTAGVLMATAAFAAASAFPGIRAWRLWRSIGGPTRDPHEPRPFVFALTVAGSVLFTIAILMAGSTPLITDTCVSHTIDPRLSAADAGFRALRPPTAQFRDELRLSDGRTRP